MSAIDVLIITALKEEFDAARQVALAGESNPYGVAEWKENNENPQVPYIFGKYVAGNTTFNVALARSIRMGGTSTSPIAASLAERLKPHCLAMCGVCAGNPGDLVLGDVVISEMVYAYDEGKRKKGGFEGDHRQNQMHDTWVRWAQELTPDDLPSFGESSEEESIYWTLERLYNEEDPRTHRARSRYFPENTWKERIQKIQKEDLVSLEGLKLSLTDKGRAFIEQVLFFDIESPARLPFQIKVGPMTSGNVVVKDGVTWDKLKQWGVRTVLGLEMEAATIGSTAYRLDIPRWIVVKGVMDYADPNKDDRIKSFAARASAEVLFKFLRQHYTESNLTTNKTQLTPEKTSESSTPEAPFNKITFEENNLSTDHSGESNISTAGVKSPEDLKNISNPQLRTAEKTTFFNVPFPSKRSEFVGRVGKREEIWNQLHEQGRASIGQPVNIKGIGGLGKTQLAVEFAHYYREKAQKDVFWLTADEDLDIQLIQIGQDLNWISQSDTGFNQAELVGNRFRKLADCLMIFDNVDDLPDIENYLPKRNSNAHILITSRFKQTGFSLIELELLDRPEARDLLLKVSGQTLHDDKESEYLEKVLEELADLPLAVELVGGYLSEHPTVTFEKYFKFLKEVPLNQLEAEFPDDSFTRHDKSIIRTLRISENVLHEKPLLIEILDILAWSGTSSMGLSLLHELTATDNEFAFENALSEAVKLRLIKQDENAERYSIHRLLARVRQFENPLKERKEWHQKIVKSLENWFRNKDEESKILTEAEIELDHLETWQQRTLEYLPSDAVWLTMLKASPLIERGNYREAQKYTEEAFELYQSANPTDNLLLAHLYNFMSQPYGYLGNYKKSEEYLKKALDFYDKKLIDDKKLLADLFSNLGSIYGDLGNYQRALKYKQQSFELRKELFGDKHSHIAISLNNLGLTYGHLGNHQKALEYKQQAFELQKELFSNKHPHIATSLDNLGGTYGDLGNHQRALEYKQQAFELRKELFGDKHPHIVISLDNLGGTYDVLGNHQKALEHKQQAFELRKELFGDKHPDIATSLNNLGSTYGDLGNHQRALEYQQQAFELQKELFGDKHPDIAISLDNLGLTYGDLGNHQKALEYQQQSFELRKELFGDKHPDIATSLDNLGGTYGYLGNHQKALEYKQQAFELRKELFGDKHPDIATSLNNLGYTHYYLGNKDKALECYESAVRIYEDILGRRHPQTIAACSSLIYSLKSKGKIVQAGNLAVEYLAYVPSNHPRRKFFEEVSRFVRRPKDRKKKGKR